LPTTQHKSVLNGVYYETIITNISTEPGSRMPTS
jgi:hypothetical protein